MEEPGSGVRLQPEQPKMSDQRSAEMPVKDPHFDAAGFFESQGMRFKGMDPSGAAKVETEDGEEGHFDVKEFLRSEGLDPNARVTYNDPSTALNESPVGLLDRLKLSLGNKKGSVEYLKNQFEDATANAQGDLVVKDKGAWKKVDLDGISDDDGWKVSEVLGDMADLTGDVIVGAGSAIGATIGAVAGGGIASAPGAIAGAAGGAAYASGAKAALGRLVGTYDATPLEVVQDVALDAVLGAAGEGVALGAKALVGPTIKRGLSKISGMGEAAADNAAQFLSTVDPVNGPDVYRVAISNADTVMPMVERFGREAEKQATLRGSEMVGAGLPQSKSMLMKEVAENAGADAAKPLIENVQGALSNYFEKGLNDLMSTHLGDVPAAARTLREAATSLGNTMENFFGKSGLGYQVNEEGVNAYKALRPKEMQAFLAGKGAPVELKVAAEIGRKLENVRNFTQGLAKSKAGSPADFKRMLSLSQELDGIVDSLPKNARDSITNSLEQLGFDAAGSIDTALTSKLPKEFATGFSGLRGAYREKRAIVGSVVGTLQKRGSNETYNSVGHKVMDLYRKSSKGDAQAAMAIKTLAEITPDGAAHLTNVANHGAAAAIANYKAVSSVMGSPSIYQGAVNLGRRQVLPAAVAMGQFGRRVNLKSFLGTPGFSQMAASAKLMKQAGPRALTNPELFGPAVTTMLSGVGADDTIKEAFQSGRKK